MHHHQAQGVAMPVLRDERQRRRDLEPGEAAELLGSVPDELVEHPEHGGGVFQVVEDRPGKDLVDLVEAILERGHDAEVATPAPQPPEEILVLALARGEERPVRGDHVGRDQVVDRQPEPAGQVADASAQRETGDARGRDDPAGCRQAEGVRCVVEVSPRGPGIGTSGLVPRIDMHGAHLRHVDDEAAVVRPESGPAVHAATHGKVEPMLPGEVHGSDDVADLLGLQDRQRPLVEHAVVYRARLVVALVLRGDHPTAHLLPQKLKSLTSEGTLYGAISQSLIPSWLTRTASGRILLDLVLPASGVGLRRVLTRRRIRFSRCAVAEHQSSAVRARAGAPSPPEPMDPRARHALRPNLAFQMRRLVEGPLAAVVIEARYCALAVADSRRHAEDWAHRFLATALADPV